MSSTEIPFSKFKCCKRSDDVVLLIIFRCAYTSMMIEIESFKKMKQNIF